jgi:NSS family neurotransmitter:Na+ symporter
MKKMKFLTKRRLEAAIFLLVFFAAITSSISLMEAVTASIIDKFHLRRPVATTICFVFSLVIGAIVCLGYNLMYCEIPLPNGTVGQILDVLDYATNSLMLPIVALLTCAMIGWVCKPSCVLDEIRIGHKSAALHREKLFVVMIKFVAPLLLLIILLQAFNLFSFM